MTKICVVGLGYVGLPTASLLASKGFDVHGVDISQEIIETLRHGKVHIIEPELDILVKSAVNSGQLHVSLEPKEADVFILAVPTPFKDDFLPDISYIEAAIRKISSYVQPQNLIILESTSPVGTTEKIQGWLKALRPDLWDKNCVYLAHCPERVLPGQIIRELVTNDRIIGGIDPASAQKAAEFYRQFVSGEIVMTDAKTAELAKLTENACRDVNIAFANELSMICDELNIDVWELIDLANRHPRINILQPGPGVGGHCIAVDPWFIVSSAPQTAKLIRTAREINDYKPLHIVKKIKTKADRLKNPMIACLGLSYKANIDDIRQSPAIAIVKQLSEERVGQLLVVEPYLSRLPSTLADADNIQFFDLETAINQADIIVLLVDHRAFQFVHKDQLQEKIVIDTRGMWR